MDFMLLYSPIGYFASMTVLLGFVYLITSFFLSKPILHNNNGVNSSRTETIDGLRGFLATAVFFHHALIYHLYLLSGIWQLPSSDFFIQLGQTGVSLFFMITGFLFFQKAIQSGGFIKWPSYIVSRIFRIGPIYFLAIGLMLLVIFVRSHWHLYVSGVTLLKQLSSFLFMGLVNVTAVNGCCL